MKLRTVYFLLALFLLVMGAFALHVIFGKGRGPKEEWVFPQLHAKGGEVKGSDIDAVELDRAIPGTDRRETLAFARGPSGWEMHKPHKLRVESYLVQRLVDDVIAAKRERSEITPNLSELGLTSPAVEVTLRKGEQSWTLKLSQEPPTKGEGAVVYAVLPGSKEPMAIRYSSVDSLYKKVNEFRTKNLITASSFDARGVAVKDAKGTEVALEKTAEGLWRFTRPPYGPAEFEGEASTTGAATAKTPTGVRDLLDAVTSLRVEDDSDFLAEGVSDGDLASKYGLASDKPETLRIEMKSVKFGSDSSKEPTTETLLIGKKAEAKKDDKDKKDDKKKDDKADYYYARMDGDTAVVRVPGAKLKTILDVLANPTPLRDRSLVQAQQKDKIDAVTIRHGDVEVRLRKPDLDWKIYRTDKGEPTEPGEVRLLIDALCEKKQAETFVDKEDGLEFDKPTVVVSLWFEGIQKEDKKEQEKKDEEKKEGDKKEEKKEDKEPKLKSDKPAVTLTFGKRDRDKGLVYVRREVGEDRTVVTVKDTLLDKVLVGPLAFLERDLPTFSKSFSEQAKDVTKVVLNRGSETWVVDKEKQGDKTVWKVAQPEALKGRTANDVSVNSIIRDLASLRADKLVAEKPPENELDQLYGLKSPQTKVTVTATKDDKPEEWVYSFGKETEVVLPGEKEKVKATYAKTDRRDVVFLVRSSRLSSLQGDLRDPTVFTFELAKVKGVKLTGWQKVAGAPITLDLKRTGEKKWEVNEPKNFNLDGDKVEQFISGLTNLRAERYVTPKSGVDAGLDVNKGALQVEITVENEAKPLQLVVGAEDPDNKNSLFARSNKAEGETFLLPKLTFQQAMEKSAYFAKP